MNHQKKAICYLRMHRRKWGLSQRELGRLLGYQSPTPISRIEGSKCSPGMEVALASQVLFGVPPDAMFPQYFGEIEERTMQRIYLFHEELINTTSLPALRKRELMRQALSRATGEDAHLPGI